MSEVQINLDGWQDYRGTHSGILFFNDTTKHAVLPVRDQMNESGKGNLTEPNYETRTIGLKSAYKTKELNNIVKSKHRYMILANKYEGINKDFKNKYLVYGYLRIDKVRDVRKIHIHHYMADMKNHDEPDCMTLDKAMAIYSEDFKVFQLEDCIVLDKELLEEWGLGSRISKQMKLVFNDENLNKVIQHFSDKKAANESYIETVTEFIEFLEDEEDEEE